MMGSMPADFPISLQSWPAKHSDPTSALPSFFQRMYLERGGLRNITEESLRHEIADEETAAAAGPEDGDVEEEPAEEEPDRLKELMTARADMLDYVHLAHNEALLALEAVSLLLTKDLPNQAITTMNPQLREIVPMGSLGADELSVSRYTESQKLDYKRVAKGWKIQSISNAVDSILAAATRLEDEITKETKYWEQILDVSDAGWSICRMPSEKHTLGVRFGFSESAPAFKNRSLAALRRNPDGTLYLDQGLASTEPRALRVQIRTSSEVTGSSTSTAPLGDDAPIESTVLEARNAIFASELWQEINRESRILGSYGVRTHDEAVTLPLTGNKTMVLDLIPLGDFFSSTARPEDDLAQGICLALHLFLSGAHRRKHRSRSQVPPAISSQKPNAEPYSLLRPLITRMNHQSALLSVDRFFIPLCAVLTSAKATPEPSFDVESTPPPAALVKNISVTEATLLALTDRLESTVTFKVTEQTSIIVKVRTATQPVCSTMYTVTLSQESPLNITCKAPRPLDRWGKVEEYVLYATSCALASSFSQPLGHEEGGTWEPTISANTLHKFNADDITERGKHLSFHVDLVKDSTKLQVKWEHSYVPGYGAEPINGKVFKKGEGSYEWKSSGDTRGAADWEHGEGEIVRSLRDVVEEAGRS